MKKLILLIIPLTISLFSLQMDDSNTAEIFLNSLDESQLKEVQFPFNDLSKERWSFLPTLGFKRDGIQLKDLNAKQKELAFKLLHSHLSKTGYDKVLKIIDLENVLAEISQRYDMRDPEQYTLAFYGDPAIDNLWAWSFEGHHISLNFTTLGDKTSFTPAFLGANPATITEGKRKGERTLVKEEDLGFELINAMSEKLKQQAIIQEDALYDIVTTNSVEVGPLNPVGVKMKELNSQQQKILVDLIDEYLSNMPIHLANTRREKLKEEEFEEIRFGWAGSTQSGEPHYYRIQGKTFLIEFDNVQNNANHIHSVWREFNGDFGRDLIREHYQHSAHHKHD
jgi:hypothetical protein